MTPFHKRVRIAYGEPKKVEVWSYPYKRDREIHAEVTTKQGEIIHLIVIVPR